jgi:outer membrane lipoprotein-sorting protein
MSKGVILVIVSVLGSPCLAGQSLPSPKEILTNVAYTYRSAQKYLIIAKSTIDSPDLNGPRSAEFTLAIELPDKMRMEGNTATLGMGAFSGPVLFVADGEITWLYDSAGKKYYKTRRSSPQGAVGKFEGRYPALDRPEQFVAYFNFFNAGRYQQLLDKNRATTITGTEVLSINGKPVECYVLQSDSGAYTEKKIGAARDTLWVDAHRPIVWREGHSAWVNNGLEEHSLTNMTAVIIDEPLPEDTFVFKPPKGSTEAPIPAQKNE